MNARTVTLLCKNIFDDRVASWTNCAGNITAEGRLSSELCKRISWAAPFRYPWVSDVSPFRATLTPEQWTLVFDTVATRTADSAITTTHTA